GVRRGAGSAGLVCELRVADRELRRVSWPDLPLPPGRSGRPSAGAGARAAARHPGATARLAGLTHQRPPGAPRWPGIPGAPRADDLGLRAHVTLVRRYWS